MIISVDWTEEYSIMRTPGHDEELTIGFLFTEGIIDSVDEIQFMRKCAGDRGGMDVCTTGRSRPPVRRTLVVNSSCGLCGRVELDALLRGLQPVAPGFKLPPDCLHDLPERMRAGQSLFESTGASHAVALFNPEGDVLAVREDVGRHNALDKVIGRGLMDRDILAQRGLFLSGRASLEMIIKAARARIPLVASVSAPTDLAVEAAERLDITLCGFVRGQDFTAYTHQERLRPNRHCP